MGAESFCHQNELFLYHFSILIINCQESEVNYSAMINSVDLFCLFGTSDKSVNQESKIRMKTDTGVNTKKQ